MSLWFIFTMPNWTQIAVTCPTPNAEAVAQLLLDAGGAGVQTDDTSLIFDQSEDATFAPREHAVITSYFAPEHNADELQSELKDMHQKLGITFVMVTHDLHEAFTLGSQVVIMNEGNIEQFDTPENIRQEPANEWVKEFLTF